MSKIHTPGTVVVWRYDADPTGRIPHAIYWSSYIENVSLGATVVARVGEDNSAVLCEPQGHAYVIVHTRSSGEEKIYHQASDGSIALPSTVNMETARVDNLPLALRRGRYLPHVGSSCISMSQRNLKRSIESRTDNVSSPPSEGARDGAAPASTAMVRLTTRVDGVGTFTQLTNGTIRCHFDDRTLLTLYPDPNDTEEGLVVHLLDRDAATCTVRAIHVLPNHPASVYLQYALPFRHFARLPLEAQKSLQFPHSVPFVDSRCEASSSTVHSHRVEGHDTARGFALDGLIFQTTRALRSIEELNKRSRELLQ
jgi:hypothetical protein